MASLSKEIILVFSLCLVLSSCDLFDDFLGKKNVDTEPPYETKIAWDSGLYSNDYASHMADGDSVFFYERPPGYTTVDIYALTRLDAETGRLIWRSDALFSNVVFCQPVAIGGYIYVFRYDNIILCFDRETGKRTARVKVGIDNKNFEFEQYATAYQDYLYMGLWTNGRYFVRFNVNLIDQNGSTEYQFISPEVLWQPETGGYVQAKPVVCNNVIYTGTNIRIQGFEEKPVEVAGFDVDTKETVFHVTFGGPEDVGVNTLNIERGIKHNPIFIHDNVLYYLSTSIAAWNLTTGEKLYRHISTIDTPEPERIKAETLQAVFYKGNIYFTDISCYEPNSTRNIFCINAATGKLVWNAIAKDSLSMDTNPVIAHDKLYVPQHHGMWVYNPENGKLIGVDRSFLGTSFGRNVLYNDYMICIQNDNSGGKLVAVYVGE